MGRTNLAGPTTHPACHPVTEKVFPQLAAAEGWGVLGAWMAWRCGGSLSVETCVDVTRAQGQGRRQDAPGQGEGAVEHARQAGEVVVPDGRRVSRLHRAGEAWVCMCGDGG